MYKKFIKHDFLISSMSKQAKPGDKVTVSLKPKGSEKGILLESHEAGVVLLKLDSGYNIGIKKNTIKKISVKEKAKPEKQAVKIKTKGGRPRINIIMVGGTISASLDQKTGGVSWLTSPKKLFQFYPEIFEMADIKIKNPFMKASESMDAGDWIRIAKETVKSLNDDQCHGVIVTHGTDFLHYTASALSFMIKDLNKPVAFTYSQRSTDRGSSDAELNLYCAAKTALSNIGEVVLVGHGSSDDDFCYVLQGNKCRKMHTSRRDAFKPINTSPIAKVSKNGEIEILRDHWKKKKRKVKLDDKFESKVALVKFYPGQSPDILEYYAKKKYKGIVIEMCGLGHVLTEGSDNWIPVIRKLVNKGMVICAAAQTLYGRLDPKVYSPGRQLEKAGVIFLKDILPETALVKLGYVLGHKEWKKTVAEKMLKNIAKEFNDRLGDEFI